MSNLQVRELQTQWNLPLQISLQQLSKKEAAAVHLQKWLAHKWFIWMVILGFWGNSRMASSHENFTAQQYTNSFQKILKKRFSQTALNFFQVPTLLRLQSYPDILLQPEKFSSEEYVQYWAGGSSIIRSSGTRCGNDIIMWHHHVLSEFCLL